MTAAVIAAGCGFRVTGDLATMTECNCSVCTKKGLLHLIVAREKFELISGAAVLEIYRFNTGTARHSFCRVCGVQPFYTPRSDPRQDRRQCALP